MFIYKSTIFFNQNNTYLILSWHIMQQNKKESTTYVLIF